MIALVAVLEREAEDADDIYGLQVVVPFVAATGLLADGKSGVVQAALLEVTLHAPLHLHQEMLAPLVHAIHVEHRTAFVRPVRQVLRVEVTDVRDVRLVGKQGAEEADQQFLVQLRAEEFLKSEIRARIDITLAKSHVVHCSCTL